MLVLGGGLKQFVVVLASALVHQTPVVNPN